jgi:hypothetical protein
LEESYANDNKLDGTDVDEVVVDAVYEYVFTGSIILEEGLLSEQDEQFEYIPLILKRMSRTGIPYGLVENAKDPQQEINKRRSKMMHLLNTNQLVIAGDPTDDFEYLRKEAARPDGVLVTNAELDIRNNLQLADGQFRAYQQSQADLSEAMGIHDEFIGEQTNAVSGRAISQRQSATMKNQAYAFDALSMFKRRVGLKMLSLIKSIDGKLLVEFQPANDPMAESRQILLNDTYEYNGKEVYVFDVNSAELGVVVEETGDYAAPPQEAADRLMNVLMNGQGFVLQSPALARLLGFRNAEDIARQVANLPASPEQQQAADEGAAPQTLPGAQ